MVEKLLKKKKLNGVTLTQQLYCSYRLLKWDIQLPRDLRVSGASFFQMTGMWPLKRDRATSSNSLLIPTSPAKAYSTQENLNKSQSEQSTSIQHLQINLLSILGLQPLHLTLCSSARESCMRTTSLLKRSSSWRRTTEVGEMSMPNFFRITSMSNNCGSLFWMSWATWLMYSSLLMCPPDSPEIRESIYQPLRRKHMEINKCFYFWKTGYITSRDELKDAKSYLSEVEGLSGESTSP